MSSSLATSSLLRAVGIGAGVVPATAMTAAIKWITKDGVGGLGRLVVGGRLSLFIDEDPRLWRMAAEAISTVGLSLEIGTIFFPAQFLLMAGTGNFAKALARGIAQPSFRVIQQHFARNNNIGEVSAKEESWEVAGQMTGLLTSVLILSLLQDSTDWRPILATWGGFHSVHVICRYLALQSLQFDSLNLTRAQRLTLAHLRGEHMPDTMSVARGENFLTDWLTAAPPIRFGCSLREFAAELSAQGCFQRWQEVFAEETYLLYVHRGRGFVVLKTQSTALDGLKSLWQFLWLMQSGYTKTPTVDHIQDSLRITNARFPDFLRQASAAGWDVENLLLRAGPVRVTPQVS